MFGRPILSPKHISSNTSPQGTLLVKRDGEIPQQRAKIMRTQESAADLEEQILNAWNLNNSVEGDVNFISDAMHSNFISTPATQK